MARLIIDPLKLIPWSEAVARSLSLAVKAHITVDMEPSLVKAYQSFSAKYIDMPPFDTYKKNFFERNLLIFKDVRTILVNELVNRGMGLAVMRKSVDPHFASKAAEYMNIGLDIGEIYRWREAAWNKAKLRLGQ